jgi:hypothetical protein
MCVYTRWLSYIPSAYAQTASCCATAELSNDDDDDDDDVVASCVHKGTHMHMVVVVGGGLQEA